MRLCWSSGCSERKDTKNISRSTLLGNLKTNMSCVSQTIEHLISCALLRGSFSKGHPPAVQNPRIRGKLWADLPAKNPLPPFPSVFGVEVRMLEQGARTFDKIFHCEKE